jgi:hypothetical protein
MTCKKGTGIVITIRFSRDAFVLDYGLMFLRMQCRLFFIRMLVILTLNLKKKAIE